MYMLHPYPFEYLLSDRLTFLQWSPLELQPLLILWFRLRLSTPLRLATIYVYISVKLTHVFFIPTEPSLSW